MPIKKKIIIILTKDQHRSNECRKVIKVTVTLRVQPPAPCHTLQGLTWNRKLFPFHISLRHTNTSSSPWTGKLFTMTKEQWGQVAWCSSQLSMHLWHPAMRPLPWWGLKPLLCTPRTWTPVLRIRCWPGTEAARKVESSFSLTANEYSRKVKALELRDHTALYTV